MEIDSEGANTSNSQHKQVDQVQTMSGNKPSKETIAAIASPQKPRQDLGQPASPKKLPSNSVANNNNASRPQFSSTQLSLLKAKKRRNRPWLKGWTPTIAQNLENDKLKLDILLRNRKVPPATASAPFSRKLLNTHPKSSS